MAKKHKGGHKGGRKHRGKAHIMPAKHLGKTMRKKSRRKRA